MRVCCSFLCCLWWRCIVYGDSLTSGDCRSGWFVVVHAKIRDVYDMGDEQSNDTDQGNEQVLQEINHNDLIRPEADDSDDIIAVTIPMENILPHDKDDNYIDDDESDADFF